jgi:hypothetical protein
MNGLKTAGNFIKHWVFGHRAPQLFLNGLRSEIKTRINILEPESLNVF